jgi:hypothetical protein
MADKGYGVFLLVVAAAVGLVGIVVYHVVVNLNYVLP